MLIRFKYSKSINILLLLCVFMWSYTSYKYIYTFSVIAKMCQGIYPLSSLVSRSKSTLNKQIRVNILAGCLRLGELCVCRAGHFAKRSKNCCDFLRVQKNNTFSLETCDCGGSLVVCVFFEVAARRVSKYYDKVSRRRYTHIYYIYSRWME